MFPPLLAVFSWPLAGLYLAKKLPVQQAMIWIILGGYLLLPERTGFNLPVLPTISKNTMPSFVALVLVWIAYKDYVKRTKAGEVMTPQNVMQPGWLPRHKLGLILVIMLVAGEFLTAATNTDRLVYGQLVLPGLTLYDGFSRVMVSMLAVLPMLLARKCLASPEQHKTLLFTFVMAGMLYSLPTLWEVRMSPQLSVDFYGVQPAAWKQGVRGGGYRPLVFLQHGLWLAIFMAMCLIASVIYIRLAAPKMKGRAIFAAVWLFATLFLSNSLGALLIAFLMIVPALLLGNRLQMLIAAGLVVILLLYPMLRGAGVIPVERAVEMAEQINPERAKSLGFRLGNEEILMRKANQRPLFGWGSWGRNQVYLEEGGNVSTTDGAWIILIGSNGWIGYLASFGLLCIPTLLLAFSGKRYPVHVATTGVMMVLAVNMLDLIPNATLTPITWLLGGALLGRLEYRAAPALAPEDRAGQEADADPPPGVGAPEKLTRGKPAYSRQRAQHVRPQRGRKND